MNLIASDNVVTCESMMAYLMNFTQSLKWRELNWMITELTSA